MWFRLLSLGSVVFCGVMTVLLVRSVYFPEFDRLPDVDPERVLELFLDTREVTQVYIYRDATVVGDIRLTPRIMPDSGEAVVGFAAAGLVELPELPAQKLNWRGKLRLGARPERVVKGLEFSVTFTTPPVSVWMEIDPETMGFHYRVKQNNVVVSDSRTDPHAVGIAQAQLMMAAWGLSPESLGDEVREKEKAFQWVAKQGTIQIAGHRAGAYFVVLGLPGMGETQLTFTEAGELLEVTTPLGYEILSEAMRKPPEPLPYSM